MMSTSEAFLNVKGLSKSFSGNQVLFDFDLKLYPGEYHGLVGENGAGKSTLINLITGIYHHDKGVISIENNTYSHLTPALAKSLGILTVHQELSINPVLTVAQNIFLGCEKLRGVFLDTKGMRRITATILEDFNLSHIRPDQDASELTMAERQMLEFAKAMYQQPKLLILDEGTSALDDSQVNIVFNKLREAKGGGMILIFVSHRHHEVKDICDNMTIMKDGCFVTTCGVDDCDDDRLVSLMTGRPLTKQFPPKPDFNAILNEPKIIEAERISFSKTKSASFCLHKGEILGIGGLQGQGQQSFLEVLFGTKRVNIGTLRIGGVPVSFSGPKAAMKQGIAYLPSERKVDGLFVTHSIRYNLSFVCLEMIRNRIGTISKKSEDRLCEKARERLSIKYQSLQQLVSELSGGNQQKVVISKWLARTPRVLLLNEPTRGIDIVTKHEIYEMLHTLTKQGVSVILISSDTIELLHLCTRVLTIYENEINAELVGDQITEESLIKASVFRKDTV